MSTTITAFREFAQKLTEETEKKSKPVFAFLESDSFSLALNGEDAKVRKSGIDVAPEQEHNVKDTSTKNLEETFKCRKNRHTGDTHHKTFIYVGVPEKPWRCGRIAV